MRGRFALAASLALSILPAALAAGQSSPGSVNPSQPYTQAGTIKKLTSDRVELQIVDAQGTAPRIMKFLINKNTHQGEVKVEQVVIVTYIKERSAMVAIGLEPQGGSSPPGMATPYGTASITSPGSKESGDKARGAVVLDFDIKAVDKSDDSQDVGPLQATRAWGPQSAAPMLPAQAQRGIREGRSCSGLSMTALMTALTPVLYQCFKLSEKDELAPEEARVLNNNDVVKLVKASLSDDLIISTINNSRGTYDTSADGVIALKIAGASDRVVSAIVAKTSAPAAMAPPAAASAAPDLNDPTTPHDPGIYIMVATSEGQRKMMPIERAASETMDVLGSAFAYGITKAKPKVEIHGPRATLRTSEESPIFFLYLPPGGESIKADRIATTGQIYLVRMKEFRNRRESMLTGTGPLSSQANNPQKGILRLKLEEIAPHTYKVAAEANLQPGEYAFVLGEQEGGKEPWKDVVAFDFGVDPK